MIIVIKKSERAVPFLGLSFEYSLRGLGHGHGHGPGIGISNLKSLGASGLEAPGLP